MKIAVFGDIHGEISKLTSSLKEYQRQENTKLDYALQVGDIGFYGEDSPRSFAGGNAIDSEFELHHRYEEGTIDELWEGDEPYEDIPPLYFVDGNHDDFLSLEMLKRDDSDTIDVTENMTYIRRSRKAKLKKGQERIDVLGLGGISKEERPQQYEENPGVAFTDEDVTDCLHNQDPDIFLTHMNPRSGGEGSQDLDDLVHMLDPRLHFFGHDGKYYEYDNVNTKTFGLKRIEYGHTKNMEQGSMKVLEIDEENYDIL